MKLLLIGCTGFIGKELLPMLINADNEIILISRKPINYFKPEKKILEKIQFIKTDLSKSENWKNDSILNALEEAQGVINLAGEPITEKRWTKQQKELIEQSRIKTTKYLVQSIKRSKNPPKVLINASAIGYYGTSLDKTFSENSPPGNDFLASVCKGWEKNALEASNKTRLIILRIGIVIGKDGGALSKMLPIFKIGLGGPIGDGKQWMSWIHRYDLCKIIIEILENKKYSGIYNAVSNEPVSMLSFTDKLSQVLKKPNLISVPSSILKLVVGDGAKLVLEGQKVLPQRLLKNKFKFKYSNILSALDAETKTNKR
tara:strand:+ start:3168 stop:4112 length:945 start_codon:yes stop_codon:yes gene_type:complete